jgi:phthalate 4,5-dioxygenase reductase subunit
VSSDQPFCVHLAKSGMTISVGADETILAALVRSGVEVKFSCQSGNCGTCRTRLIAGSVDHRDFVLDDEEYATNIMICVSRAAEGDLTLDL